MTTGMPNALPMLDKQFALKWMKARCSGKILAGRGRKLGDGNGALYREIAWRLAEHLGSHDLTPDEAFGLGAFVMLDLIDTALSGKIV